MRKMATVSVEVKFDEGPHVRATAWKTDTDCWVAECVNVDNNLLSRFRGPDQVGLDVRKALWDMIEEVSLEPHTTPLKVAAFRDLRTGGQSSIFETPDGFVVKFYDEKGLHFDASDETFERDDFHSALRAAGFGQEGVKRLPMS